MSTAIEWCNALPGYKGETWNPVIGCSPVDESCEHCYAARMASRGLCEAHKGLAKGGKWTGEVRLVEPALDKPLHWRAPRFVFVCSMSDLFYGKVAIADEFRVLSIAEKASQHIYVFLTKRPQWMGKIMAWYARLRGAIPANWWLGVSVPNQEQADKRIPLLLQTPAAVRFVSVEPMLGAVDLSPWLRLGWVCEFCFRRELASRIPEGWDLVWGCGVCPDCQKRVAQDGGYSVVKGGAYATVPEPRPWKPRLDWVICGAETGPGARPMDNEWAHDLRRQCEAAGGAFFFKKSSSGSHQLDGRTYEQMPEVKRG